MAANYGMRRRDLHALYPALWAAADEETREKAVKRYEQRLKSRDKQKTDILSREAWIACKIIVDGWRRHNPASVEAWAALETGMRDAMRDPGVAKLALGRIKYLAKSGFLWCMTPSGRCIAYASPKLKDQVWAKLRLEDGSWSEAEVVEREEAMRLEATGRAQIQGATTPKVTALGVDSTTQKMTRYALYGGLAMENLAMGCERDILVNGMRRCETAGYAITLHNYDEAVAEVPRSFGSVEEMERLMLDLPSWTAGLPLAAHGWRGKRYAKR
jgi:DNA polymerase